jgi:hypothetical protein
MSRWRLWRRWVVANVVGELIGFGGAATLSVLAMQAIGASHGFTQVLVTIVGVLSVGAFEGLAVGVAQWRALRGALPSLSARAWIAATVAGAIVAWGVGMAIGTRLGDGTVASPGAAELPWPMVTVGAMAIGALAGSMLAGPQWLVLRRAVPRAVWWVPAHGVAWALGMLVAFGGVSLIDEQTALAQAMVIGAGTGLAMGGVVSALTGLALVGLVAPEPTRRRDPARSVG